MIAFFWIIPSRASWKWILHNKSLRSYEGNYSDYLERKRSENDKQWAEYRDQQLEVRCMKADIARAKEQAASTEHKTSSVRVSAVPR